MLAFFNNDILWVGDFFKNIFWDPKIISQQGYKYKHSTDFNKSKINLECTVLSWLDTFVSKLNAIDMAKIFARAYDKLQFLIIPQKWINLWTVQN